MGVTIIKDEHALWDTVEKELRSFKHSYVKVGVLESAPMHKGKTEDGETEVVEMATIAAVHEFGANINVTDKMRKFLHVIGIHLRKETNTIVIPQRSFLRGWTDDKKEEITNEIDKLLTKVTNNQLSANEALNKLGAFGEGGVKSRFRNNDWEPLKVRVGGTPLVDSGQLINSIHHEVVLK